MSNTYLSCFDYLRATTGQETASLLGNTGYIGGTVSAGATSFPVLSATAVQLNVNDQLYIFDGGSSEIAIVAAQKAIGSTSITVQPLQYAHTANVPYCSDGAYGSLGSAIFTASANLETITQQSLLQATYSETYSLRTMDANINSDSQLTIRTRQFPVTAISALSLESDVSDITSLDATQAVISSQQKLVSVPVLSQVGAGSSQLTLSPPINQSSTGYINLTYTAGYPYASMPAQVKQACVWLVSDILSDRMNPTGSADYQSGKIHTVVFLRGDTSGESALFKRARTYLEPHMRER